MRIVRCWLMRCSARPRIEHEVGGFGFKRTALHNRRQVGLVAVQALLNIVLASALLWLFARFLFAETALPALAIGNIAKVGSGVIATISSFMLSHYVIFKPRAELPAHTPTTDTARNGTHDL